MKYINKKTNLFVLIVSSLLLCIFTGCSNFTDVEEKVNAASNNDKQITVTGKIFQESNRSANTSYTLTSNHKLNIWATQEKSGGEPLSAVAQITGNNYTLKLSSYGDWTIHLYITCENKDGQESVLVNLSKDISVSKDDSSITLTEPFVIQSGYSTVHNGDIRLAFEDESGKILSMTYSAALRGSETGNENSLKDGGTIYFADDFHDAALQLDNVSPNSYEVTFCFNDIKGNTLYSCKEIITVLAGFTTDTWIGNGAHLRKDSRTGETEFVITNDLIDSFGTEVVPDTQMVFYNYEYSNSNHYYKYFLSDDILTTIPDSISLNERKDSSPNFFFDNNGKLYAYNEYYDNDNFYQIVTSDNEYNIANLISNQSVNSVCYDRKTDKVYVSTFRSSDWYLYSCEKNNLQNITNSARKYNISTESITTNVKTQFKWCKSYTVYDNILYVPYIKVSSEAPYSASLVLLKKDITSAVFNETDETYIINITDSDLKTYNLFSDLPDSEQPAISDILYQDGSLYVLVNDIYIHNDSGRGNSLRSRGAVIRINLFINKLDVLGWTDEEMDVSTTGSYGFIDDGLTSSELYSDSAHTKRFVFDGTKTYEMDNENQIPISAMYPKFYVPDGGQNLSSNALYGPKHFIAIKPKKLVISDDGIAFYTNDDGALAYRNVNRAVIVDLEKFAITSCSEVPVKYEGGCNSIFAGDYTDTIKSNISLSDVSSFYYASSEFGESIYTYDGVVTNSDYDSLYLAIYREDN